MKHWYRFCAFLLSRHLTGIPFMFVMTLVIFAAHLLRGAVVGTRDAFKEAVEGWQAVGK